MSIGVDEERLDNLNTEIELVEASLLPPETLDLSSREALPRVLDISSTDSNLRLSVRLGETYPERGSVVVEVKGDDVGREQAEEWRSKIDGMLGDWDEQSETPLYTIMTTHLLPLLARPKVASFAPAGVTPAPIAPVPHHALIITHHLLSSTKRKLLLQLSSELNLTGFSKTGHPGILYAMGEKEDISEWLVQVKSWNWLALKVRITCESIPSDLLAAFHPFAGDAKASEAGTQQSDGEKARGDWVELEKLGDALEWMRVRGREQLLIDAGVGSSTH